MNADVAAETDGYAGLNRLAAAGFSTDSDGGALLVSPAGRLSATQRNWLTQHKTELLGALAAVSGRWCIEYPRSAVAADSGTRLVADYSPATDWRRVSREYPGAAVWPAHDGLDVAAWLDDGDT